MILRQQLRFFQWIRYGNSCGKRGFTVGCWPISIILCFGLWRFCSPYYWRRCAVDGSHFSYFVIILWMFHYFDCLCTYHRIIFCGCCQDLCILEHDILDVSRSRVLCYSRFVCGSSLNLLLCSFISFRWSYVYWPTTLWNSVYTWGWQWVALIFCTCHIWFVYCFDVV